MLKIFFTVDVEIWCNGWRNIDEQYPDAFRRYIYGHTKKGDYGLPLTLQILNDHGLNGVFFVEPLFATRFGMAGLEEIIGLIKDANQEIQLHLHTEWVDEASKPILPGMSGKRQYMRLFSESEQQILIEKGMELLNVAGVPDIQAFRAGSFGFNRETICALNKSGISYDCSYNACMFGRDSGVSPGKDLLQPVQIEGVWEYPMSIFKDGYRRQRHAQLGASSFEEMQAALWAALHAGWESFVMLSHNFEMLDNTKSRPDTIVKRRFERLCRFLDNNRDCFAMSSFKALHSDKNNRDSALIDVPVYASIIRSAEQALRKVL